MNNYILGFIVVILFAIIIIIGSCTDTFINVAKYNLPSLQSSSSSILGNKFNIKKQPYQLPPTVPTFNISNQEVSSQEVSSQEVSSQEVSSQETYFKELTLFGPFKNTDIITNNNISLYSEFKKLSGNLV